jgi:hypothetical protein
MSSLLSAGILIQLFGGHSLKFKPYTLSYGPIGSISCAFCNAGFELTPFEFL